MKIRPLHLVLLGLAGLLSYAAYLVWRADKDLVTLQVRNAPLEKVIRQLRWQTWERFAWHKDLGTPITLDVKRMPLENVLEIISEQMSARWTVVYPIYTRKAAIQSLERALRGEIEFAQSSFTNFQSRGFRVGRGGPGFGGGFLGATEPEQPRNLISLNITNKDLNITAVALSRFGGRAQVVPENGIKANINLLLQNESMDRAVDQVAGQARRSWTKIYALQPGRGFGGPGFAAAGERGGEGRFERRGDGARDERSPERERLQAELLDLLPPEQKERMQAGRELMQAMQSLPPEQRQQLFAERMNNPAVQQQMQQRMTGGIRNSTPEQRRERYERMHQRRKASQSGAGPSR